jgi:hypothetical protein
LTGADSVVPKNSPRRVTRNKRSTQIQDGARRHSSATTSSQMLAGRRLNRAASVHVSPGGNGPWCPSGKAEGAIQSQMLSSHTSLDVGFSPSPRELLGGEPQTSPQVSMRRRSQGRGKNEESSSHGTAVATTLASTVVRRSSKLSAAEIGPSSPVLAGSPIRRGRLVKSSRRASAAVSVDNMATVNVAGDTAEEIDMFKEMRAYDELDDLRFSSCFCSHLLC